MIGILDVDYRNDHARAACVLINSWADSSPAATYIADVNEVHPYEPGRFYLRELPCLMAVVRLLPVNPEILVVDGYVWLGADRRPGLGAYLHAATGNTAVAGIAKTKFRGMSGSQLMALVYRGQARNPLYVTAVGLGLNEVASGVGGMHGTYRIPDMVRLTDHLARSTG